MLLEEPLGQRHEILAGLGENEGSGFIRPFQLEACGEGGDPDLADRSVRGEDEFTAIMLEDDVENAVFFFGLKWNLVRLTLFFSPNEGLFQSIEGLIGFAAESGFIEHKDSVAGWPFRWIE